VLWREKYALAIAMDKMEIKTMMEWLVDLKEEL
jgi:hypothetical protein